MQSRTTWIWNRCGSLLAVVGLICWILATPVTAKPPSILSVRADSTQVGLYEKFELRIDLQATYTNPFDPGQIDLRAEFIAPSGRKWSINGFYNPSSWASLWMVRFSPNETGAWRYAVTVTDAQGTSKAQTGKFTAIDSPHHGPIGIGRERTVPPLRRRRILLWRGTLVQR